MPERVPIEGWPVNYQGKKVTLLDVQRDRLGEGGDRHAIVVDPVRRMLYEFYQTETHGRRLAGRPGLDLRPEDQQVAARRLDLDRRGGLAHLSRPSSATTSCSGAWSAMPCG